MSNDVKYEVLGVGTPIIDQIIFVPEEFLAQIPGTKGGMLPVDYQTLTDMIQKAEQPLRLSQGAAVQIRSKVWLI